MNVAENIRKERLSKNWTQTDLAEAIGTSQQQIARYETEARDVPVKVLIKIANALEVEPSKLFL